MTETSSKRGGFKTQMRDMKVGDELKFPIAKTPSVRSIASDLGLCLYRKYRTMTNAEDRTVKVVRIS
jgi:hypothetical protein